MWIASALALGCNDDSGRAQVTGGDASTSGSASIGGTDSTTSDTAADTDGGTVGEGTTASGTATTSGLDSTTTSNETIGTTDTGEPTSDTDAPCNEGDIICEDGIAKVCDGMGGFSSEEPCAEECANGLGCVACIPGEGYCDGDVAYKCNTDGTDYEPEECDPVQGMTCDQGSGTCIGACSAAALGNSYIGCDYYPTITPNPLLNPVASFDFAVAVSNTANQVANVTVTRGGNVVTMQAVPANSVAVIKLPWITAMVSTGETPSTNVVVDGAYRLRSDRPVSVYQYNPLQYTNNGQFSYTNDATLLLPANTWGTEVRVVSRNHWQLIDRSTFFSVVAKEDGTMVTLTPSASGVWVRPGAGVQANGTGNVVLNADDVLQVFTAPANVNPQSTSDGTGTLVTASAPVQVIGGALCATLPESQCCCDHLEEAIPPLDSVGKTYYATAPLITPQSVKNRWIRVVATEEDTDLTFSPQLAGAPASLANAGDYWESGPTTADVQITSSKKILVSEYMLGHNAGGDKGDPAMTLAVPVEQFRTNYLVHAPTNYQESYANLVAPTGTMVTVDGVQVASWTPIGATGYSVARVQLSNAGDGNHILEGDEPFGINVYGYGQWTSYWYAGGLDLDLVPQ